MPENIQTVQSIGDTIHTSIGLRDILFKELQTLQAGSTSVPQAKAIVRLADKILLSIKYEIEWYAMTLGITDFPGNTLRELPGLGLGKEE